MCLLVEGREDLAAVAEEDHWPRMLALGVAQHLDWAKRDALKGEAGVPGCLDGFAAALGLSNCGVVQGLGHGLHCCHYPGLLGRTRHHVRHHVVCTGHMANVVGELRDVAEVVVLPGCPGLCRLGEGEGKRSAGPPA